MTVVAIWYEPNDTSLWAVADTRIIPKAARIDTKRGLSVFATPGSKSGGKQSRAAREALDCFAALAMTAWRADKACPTWPRRA